MLIALGFIKHLPVQEQLREAEKRLATDEVLRLAYHQLISLER